MPNKRVTDLSEVSSFPSTNYNLITLAHALGWSVWSNGPMVVLRSTFVPDKTINVPKASLNDNRRVSMLHQIGTNTDPEIIRLAVDEGIINGQQVDLTKNSTEASIVKRLIPLAMTYKKERQELVDASVKELVDAAVETTVAETAVSAAMAQAQERAAQRERQVADERPTWTEEPHRTMSGAGDWIKRTASDGAVVWVCRLCDPPAVVDTPQAIGGHMRMMHRDAVAAAPEPVAPVTTENLPDGVISAKPWLARRAGKGDGTGLMYASAAVMEWTYADGRVEFNCSECTYHSPDRPRSVSAHYAGSHASGEGRRPAPTAFEVATYEGSGMVRNASAERRLRSEIMAALDQIEDFAALTSEELARTLASQMLANRPDRAPLVALTADETLARIKALVDRGEYDSLHTTVRGLEAQVVALNAENGVLHEVNTRFAGDVTALRELIESIQLSTPAAPAAPQTPGQ